MVTVRAEDEGPSRVGVLFVHGIGESAQSGTLREFSQPIVSWLQDWHAQRGEADRIRITSSALSYGGHLGDAPAHFTMRIEGPEDGAARTIVFAEGWWAARLAPPAPLEVIQWSFVALWRAVSQLALAALRRGPAIWRHVANGGKRPGSPLQRLQAATGITVEYFSQLLLAVGYLLGGLSGYAVLVPLAILVQVPIPQIQEFILVRLLRPMLVNYLGDFEVYVADEVQALNVRSAVEHAADWLAAEGGCERICVIAHSQGAVVAYDAVAAQASHGMAKVTKLITMGGALNRAWGLGVTPRRLLARLPARVRWLDIWTTYDPVPGGPITRSDQAVSQEVTNGMNVLTDHGGYFHNREEVIARLVQEIDVTGPGDASRFAFADQDLRVRHRWERTITLVFWRLIAMFFFGLVVLRRGPILAADGRVVWSMVSNLPGVTGAADAARALLESLSGVLTALAAATAGLPPVSKLALAFGLLARPDDLEPVAMAIMGITGLVAIFTFVYLVLTWIFYRPWVEADDLRAVAPRFTQPRGWENAWRWIRLMVVPAVIVLLALQLRGT